MVTTAFECSVSQQIVPVCCCLSKLYNGRATKEESGTQLLQSCASPRNPLSCLFCFRCRESQMPFTLSRSVKSPSLDTVCPKHFTLALQNCHFSLDTYVPLKLTLRQIQGVLVFIKNLKTTASSTYCIKADL